MTRRTRLRDTAYPLGKILQFPVRHDTAGQYELFPEPPGPDPFSASQLVIRFTLIQMRLTRIAPSLSPSERLRWFGEADLLLPLLERMEELVALRQRSARVRIA